MTQETLIALFGGGVAGAMLQSLFKFLTTRKSMTLSNEEKLRQELQDQLDALRAEVEDLKKEVDVWRDKYFNIYEEHIQLKVLLNGKNPT